MYVQPKIWAQIFFGTFLFFWVQFLSVQISFAASPLQLFAEENYQGDEISFEEGEFRYTKSDNQIGSMTVDPAYTVLACANADGSAPCRVYSGGKYPSFVDLEQQIEYLCVFPQGAQDRLQDDFYGKEITYCADALSHPIPTELTSVESLSQADCEEIFEYELTENNARTDRSDATFTSNVLVLVHNPLIQKPNTTDVQSLYEWAEWISPDVRAACYANFFEHTSNGRMNFEILGRVEIDQWADNDMVKGIDFLKPLSPNGLQEEEIEAEQSFYIQDPNDKMDAEIASLFDRLLLNGNSVCGMIANGEIDEVWIYTADGFGYFETALAGGLAVPYNWKPLTDLQCGGNTVRLLGFLGDKSLKEDIHTMVHATESIMDHAYHRSDNDSDLFTTFFRRSQKTIKEAESAEQTVGCGDAHFAPTTETYFFRERWENERFYGDWAVVGNPTEAYQWEMESYCHLFPTLATHGDITAAEMELIKNRAETINCDEWNCTEIGFYEYWFENLSDGIGCDRGDDKESGVDFDWWRYIYDPMTIYTPCVDDPSAPAPTIPTIASLTSFEPYCDVTYTLIRERNQKFLAKVEIENLTDQPMDGWHLHWGYAHDSVLQAVWNGTFTQIGHNVTISRQSSFQNGVIAPHDSLSITFRGKHREEIEQPEQFFVNGRLCESQEDETVEIFSASKEKCAVTYQIYQQKRDTFRALLQLTNNGIEPIEGWMLSWDFLHRETMNSLRNAVYAQNGASVQLSNPAFAWNGTIQPEESVQVRFLGTHSGDVTPPETISMNDKQCELTTIMQE